MSAEQTSTREQIAHDLPIYHRTLTDIKQQADVLNKQVQELLEKVRAGDFDMKDGITLLHVKNLSMMQYNANAVRIVGQKVAGESLQEGDAVWRSVEQRVVLEKIVPLEKKIRYQIDKIIAEGGADKANKLSHTGGVDDGFSDGDSDEENSDGDEDDEGGDVDDVAVGAADSMYRAPRLAAEKYDENMTGGKQARLKRQHDRAVANSSVIRDLLQGTTDEPEEISNGNSERMKHVRVEQETVAYEEVNYTRVQASKKTKHAKLQAHRTSGLNEITHFGGSFLYSNKKDGVEGPKVAGQKRRKSGGRGRKGGAKKKQKK